jgi:hypothetical protein
VALRRFDDLLYRRGPILADVSPAHAISAASAMIMSACVIAGALAAARAHDG